MESHAAARLDSPRAAVPTFLKFATPHLKVKSPTLSQNPRQGWGTRNLSMCLERCVEVEHVADLEAGAVHENQIASNEVMSISRCRRRKHHFKLMRAGLHSLPKLDREISMNDELTFQTRRQAISLGQSWRQMRIVSAIPVMD